MKQELSSIERIGTTLSVCPSCESIIKADIIKDAGKVFIKKNHCGHEIKALQENDSKFYEKTMNFDTSNLCKDFKINSNFTVSQKKSVLYYPQVYLQITKRCNLSCPICYELKEHKNLDINIETVKKIVEISPAKFYTLSGGDPTMHENLFEIIKFLKSKGKFVSLLTNGIKLSKKDFTKKLKESGVDDVCLSFDGFDENVYKQLRGEKLLEKKMKSIDNLSKENMSFGLYTVVDKEINFNQIKSIIDFSIQNDGRISKIWFGCMNQKEKTITTKSDVWKVIEKEYNIPIDYVIEEWRLRYLINRLSGKFFGEKGMRAFTAINHNSIYTVINQDSINTLFKLKELKKMNNVLEKSLNTNKGVSILNIMGNLKCFLNKGSFKLFKSLFLSRFSVEHASKNINKQKIIRLRVGGVSESYTADLMRTVSLIPYGVPIVMSFNPLEAAKVDTPM